MFLLPLPQGQKRCPKGAPVFSQPRGKARGTCGPNTAEPPNWSRQPPSRSSSCEKQGFFSYLQPQAFSIRTEERRLAAFLTSQACGCAWGARLTIKWVQLSMKSSPFLPPTTEPEPWAPPSEVPLLPAQLVLSSEKTSPPHRPGDLLSFGTIGGTGKPQLSYGTSSQSSSAPRHAHSSSLPLLCRGDRPPQGHLGSAWVQAAASLPASE